jgi:prepilin-type N-terminal cleavage/methylation domain-containing protein
MGSRNTSIKRRRQAGLTMVELMVAVAIGSVALLGLSMLSVYTARSFAAMANYVDLDRSSRKALDNLTKIVRESDGLLEFSAHELELSYGGENVKFTYSEQAKTLVYKTENFSKTLLTGCDFLKFEVFQRNTEEGTYDQFPTTLEDSDAKLIQVTWICSKSVLGKLINSESVQSAKIVIRKQ